MKNVPVISVIVPIYNVADYLDECVSSIVGQDLCDIEIILIDDGSSDGSAEKCDCWASKDERVVVVHKKNGGLSSARNAGLDICRGRWIRFVDSDDVLPLDSLSRLVDAATDDSDMVCGQYRGFVDKLPKSHGSHGRSVSIDWHSTMLEMLYQHHISSSVCDKLFGKDLFTTVRFREGILYEDLECLARIIPLIRRTVVVDDVVYFYRKRPGSILNVLNKRRLVILDITKDIRVRMGSIPSRPLEKAASDRELSANFNMFLLLNKHGMGHGEDADRCWKVIKCRRIVSLFNPKVRMKNKVGIMLSFGGRKFFSLFKSVC